MTQDLITGIKFFFFFLIVCSSTHTFSANESEECYEGDAKIVAGQSLGLRSGPLVLKVKFAPKNNQIVQTLYASPRSYYPYKEVLIKLDQTGDSTFRENASTSEAKLFSGVVRARGPKWDWTDWTVQRELAVRDGGKTTGTMFRTKTTLKGSLVTEKNVKGRKISSTEEFDFRRIDLTRCNDMIDDFRAANDKKTN